MKVKIRSIFWVPYAGPGELKAGAAQGGNPLLGPWANRLDQGAF